MDYQLQFGLADMDKPTIKGQPDNEAIKLIQFYEKLALEADPRGYCVCTSEGKDSRVLGHLMRRAKVKHFYLHNITGIDPPELIYFQRRNFQEYRDMGYLTYDIMPRLSMWRLMEKKTIPPIRQKRYCCAELKENHVSQQGDAIVALGVRKAESANRAKKRDELEIVTHGKHNIIMPWDNNENRRTFEVCYKQCEKRVNPIAYWNDTLLWDYIKDTKLEQCSLYEEGYQRLGCIGCPMPGEKQRRRDFARWKAFEAMYLRAFERMTQKRKANGMPVKHKSAQEWFECWIADEYHETEIDENQIMI